jgi:hypothetical protein
VTKGLSWTDVLAREPAFVVLVRQNRLQVIVRPGQKQLRRRGQRGWAVAAAIDAAAGGGPVPPELREAVVQALEALDGGPKGKKAGSKKKHRPPRAG